MPIVNQITLPQEILDRVARVVEYHDSSRWSPASLAAEPVAPDPANQPYEFRIFENLEGTSLPTGFLDPAALTLSLMRDGLAAVPPEQVGPPQDLKTLATWLQYADGIAQKKRTITATHFTRTCFSDGNCFPCELYVAAFAVEGLDAGFYHYNPREFTLRKMRDGGETIARLVRGRPDLAFLKTVPAAMFVSTIFCRSTWRFGRRGYRAALHDAGYLVQNLVTVATGLGIQTMTRLQMNDSATRELIGVRADADFGHAEAVQAMVAWADRATCPIALGSAQKSADTQGNVPAVAGPMPPIERGDLANGVVPYVSILETHQACVAPGMAVREVRPPYTDLSPLAPNHPTFDVETSRLPDGSLPPTHPEPQVGQPLRKVLATRLASPHFTHAPVARDAFLAINRLAFRGGTYFPLHPEGPHVALVRPFWFVHAVHGMDAGIWYYHPPSDRWSILRHGTFRKETAKLAVDQAPFGHAAAVCFVSVNLGGLLPIAGPDIYRLAHLEAGMVTNRLALSSEALDLNWFETGSFYDEPTREFLGMLNSGWEVLDLVAIGSRPAQQ